MKEEFNSLIDFIESQMNIILREINSEKVSDDDIIDHVIGRFTRIECEIDNYRFRNN